MWKPAEIFLYNWWPIAKERQIYSKLGEMKVIVKLDVQSEIPSV